MAKAKTKTPIKSETAFFKDFETYYNQGLKESNAGRTRNTVVKKSTNNLEACARLLASAGFTYKLIDPPKDAKRPSTLTVTYQLRLNHKKFDKLGDGNFVPGLLLYSYGNYDFGVYLRFTLDYRDYDFSVPYPSLLRIPWEAPKEGTWDESWGDEQLEKISEGLPEFLKSIEMLSKVSLSRSEISELKTAITNEIIPYQRNNYYEIIFSESPTEVFDEKIVYQNESSLLEAYANICGVYLAKSKMVKGKKEERNFVTNYTYVINKKGVREDERRSGSLRLPRHAMNKNMLESYNRVADVVMKSAITKIRLGTTEKRVVF